MLTLEAFFNTVSSLRYHTSTRTWDMFNGGTLSYFTTWDQTDCLTEVCIPCNSVNGVVSCPSVTCPNLNWNGASCQCCGTDCSSAPSHSHAPHTHSPHSHAPHTHFPTPTTSSATCQSNSLTLPYTDPRCCPDGCAIASNRCGNVCCGTTDSCGSAPNTCVDLFDRPTTAEGQAEQNAPAHTTCTERTWPRVASMSHTHSPHSHYPHTHWPASSSHTHSPHSHYPHTQRPHGHSPATHTHSPNPGGPSGGSSASNLEQSGSDSSTGIIFGAVAGGVTLVGAVLATVFYIKKRAKKSPNNAVTVTGPPSVQMSSTADTHPTDKI